MGIRGYVKKKKSRKKVTQFAITPPDCDWNSLPVDVWAEIMLKLAIHALPSCRSVCKTWNSIIVSHEFCKRRMKLCPNLPMSGLIYQRVNLPGDVRFKYYPFRVFALGSPPTLNFTTQKSNKPKSSAYYVDDGPFLLGGTRVELDEEEKKLTIDLPAGTFDFDQYTYVCHKGLLLIIRFREPAPCSRFLVSNPATAQMMEIPGNSLHQPEVLISDISFYVYPTIFNLSEHREERICHFMVLIFIKGRHKNWIDVYYSYLRKWVRSNPFNLDKKTKDFICPETFSDSSTFTDNILYFDAGPSHIGALRFIKFPTRANPAQQLQIVNSYSLPKPINVWNMDGHLEVVTGSLFYACFHDHAYLSIWRLNNNNKREWIQVICSNHHLFCDYPLCLFRWSTILALDYPIVLIRHLDYKIYAYNILTHTLELVTNLLSFQGRVCPFYPCIMPIY